MAYAPLQLAQHRKSQLVRQAREQAAKLAEMLRRDFGVRRVLLFGSLRDGKRFGSGSDIDLAVEGLPYFELFRAIGRAIQQCDWDVDIKPMEEVSPTMREHIERTGEEL